MRTDRTPQSDTAPASWVVSGLARFGSGVGSLVPSGFDAYARICHPARLGERDVTWASVAAANTAVAHAGMEWVAITGDWRYLHDDDQPGLWEYAPEEGSMPRPLALRVGEVLARFSAATRYWFALWEGWGDAGMQWDAPRVPVEARAMYLFAGTRDDVGRPFSPPPWEQSANLWWPDDRAWCVATDIDLMSSYVAASRAAVDALLADPGIEAYEVARDQTVSWDGDLLNPTPARPN